MENREFKPGDISYDLIADVIYFGEEYPIDYSNTRIYSDLIKENKWQGIRDLRHVPI